MKNSLGEILQTVIKSAKPSDAEMDIINESIEGFIRILNLSLKKMRIDAEPFIGGSIAKNTIIKRKRYDIDVFVRFSYEKYRKSEKELGSILEKAVIEAFNRLRKISGNNIKFRVEKIHGSRDYFNIHFYNKRLAKELILEIVPTLAVKNPRDALNITDLSFSHVKYVVNGLKKRRLRDDIIAAKAFCYAQGCYGAESHIRGFSGYAIELLILNYGGFEKFVRAASEWEDKVIIDIAKKYKSRDDVMVNMNEAKLKSPIVLVDPTYSIRNACAALSNETFKRFIDTCKKFIKNPSMEAFREHKTDKKELVKYASLKNAKLVVLRIKVRNDKEDIAAAKTVKFCNFLIYNLEREEFKVIKKEVEFICFKDGEYTSLFYVIYKEPPTIEIIEGPPLSMKEHAERFRQKYKKCFVKDNKMYAKIKRRIRKIKDLVEHIKKGSELKDMQVSRIEIKK